MSSLLTSFTILLNSWAVQDAVGFLIILPIFFRIQILHRIPAERINARFEGGTFVLFDPAATAESFQGDIFYII